MDGETPSTVVPAIVVTEPETIVNVSVPTVAARAENLPGSPRAMASA